MGGSSSQRRTNPPMSPIHAFPIEDMCTHEFSDSFQQNTSSFQETTREDSPVEVVTSPPKTKKPIRGRQKRTIQSDDAPRQIAWTNAEEIALCKDMLCYVMKSIQSISNGILLSQKKYILELLQSAGLSNCNPVPSPMVTSSSLSLDDSSAFSNPVKYRQLNEFYFNATVEHGMLIRHSSGSTLQAFTDVLWKGNPDTSLEAFSDANWTGDLDDRQSTGGFAIYLGSHLISWTARKQRTVS
ncbi:retrovirus-related pol polyprotein from transposon TNT 1-94, partial [Tanacetum coccineum]